MQKPRVLVATLLASTAIACTPPAPERASAPVPAASSSPRAGDAAVVVDASDAGDVADAGDAAASRRANRERAKGDEEFFSLRMQPYDVYRAFDATFATMSAQAAPPLADAIVLCRVSLVEPAPKPKSAWDRQNGRDLMLESVVDDATTKRFQAQLGQATFVARIDPDLRAAAAGKRVRWVLHDRDQTRASPYEESIVVGSLDAPANAKLPFELAAPTMHMTCRAASAENASNVLLPQADRALASVDAKLTWSGEDPRQRFVLVQTLEQAAQQLRIGSAIARAVGRMDAWNEREARLRAIVDRYLAKEREWFAHLAPVPVGTWAPLGTKMTVRVVERVCPAVPKGADPGSLRDDDREHTECGLALELRTVGKTKLEWDPNAFGPAYACRQMPLAIDSVDAPGKIETACVDGIRQGTSWKKSSVDLSPTQSTTVILSTDGLGRALRVSFDAASVLLAVPPAP